MSPIARARRFSVWISALAMLFIALTACSPSEPSDRLDIVTADGVRHVFHIELAAKAVDRERGLMYRQSIDSGAGMLFDFGEEQPVSMWMKNTFISLDMLFIANSGVIVRIAADTVPQSLDVIPSGRPVRAVLEIKGGEAARLGVTPGARVVYPLFK